MKIFIDQLGRDVTIAWPPKRIISLVPSQSELLHSLGLEEEVIGITKFCVHPVAWYHSKKRVGGTKKYNFEAIAALQPDLIIANKEENEQEQITALSKIYPVWISDIYTLNDALDMIEKIGLLTNREGQSHNLIRKIKNAFDTILNLKKGKLKAKSAAYFIWNNPKMSVNNDCFIHDMLLQLGLCNSFANIPNRYPEVSEQLIKEANPDYIFLSSEPFPFKDKHIHVFQKLCPKAKVVLVDGEYFSWYGSRLQNAPHYFKTLVESLGVTD